ncbi:hypothetical protein NC797_16735 [Aquibacillus sp. 3ASR75-11]|uniref:ABC-2 type transport system permease protein n=1 Tax=Terrihalobacillus insolitus TaxID=2950438 RepID=A0A9X4ANT5_9BACI|nr:hypothetical protein [Terrihalobacillus insolitus]MDC3426144.1 hypothetical protein [Terrihalobacillus insolitus]
MPLRTSWYKRELGKQSLRNVGWIGIIYFIGLFLALPLDIFMRASNDDQVYYNDQVPPLFELNFEIQFLAMVIIPVLLAVFLFRYVQVKGAADFVHSLPIKRTTIFNHYVLIGLSLLIIPVLLIAILLLSLDLVIDIDQYADISSLWSWIGITIVVNSLIFFAGVFVGMVTGISAVQGVLTYILLLFPAGIFVLALFNLNILYYGFPENYFYANNLYQYSPLTEMVNMELGLVKGILYAVLSVALYFFSLQIYRIRNVEAATQTLVFLKLRPIFKFGVTACMMLLGGLYFGTMPGNLSWTMAGYVIGSIIGYLLAEMILQKTWRVFSNLKGYLYYVAITALIMLVLSLDPTGYENRVPDTSEVERVYFGDIPNYYEDADGNPINEIGYLTDPKNIEAVRRLHQQLIQSKQMTTSNDNTYRPIYLTYNPSLALNFSNCSRIKG